jgi:hypothetical protein
MKLSLRVAPPQSFEQSISEATNDILSFSRVLFNVSTANEKEARLDAMVQICYDIITFLPLDIHECGNLETLDLLPKVKPL